MLSETKTMPNGYYILNSFNELIIKIKIILQKIFEKIHTKSETNTALKKFRNESFKFAKNLKENGLKPEYNNFMTLESMTEYLVFHDEFLEDNIEMIYNAFEEFKKILSLRINSPEDYKKEYDIYKSKLSKTYEYFHEKIYTPSEKYNENALNNIISLLGRD